MSEVCFSCSKNHNVRIGSAGIFKAVATILHSPSLKLQGISSVKSQNSSKSFVNSVLNSKCYLSPNNTQHVNLIGLSSSGLCTISGSLKVQCNIKSRLTSVGQFNKVKTDKFAGNITQLKILKNFQATQKLYPINDIATCLNNSCFVNKFSNQNNLYSNIDEGVFAGNYIENGTSCQLVSDDNDSYIQPLSVFTSGSFRYSCEVTPPSDNMRQSFLFIRAAAPTSTLSSNIPPQYKIHNIQLLDPSGNIIVKYKDIVLRGDADYSTTSYNFTTYISEPEINNVLLNTWQDEHPIMGLLSGYILNLDFNIECLDDPFSEGFDKGYEDTCVIDLPLEQSSNNYLALDGSPLSTQNQGFTLNPDNTLRISAIEICNSGFEGVTRDNYLNFYTSVESIGNRLIKYIAPNDVIPYNQNVDIYPETYSVWESSPDPNNNIFINSDQYHNKLAALIKDEEPYNYIKLLHSYPNIDSGRLTLHFNHTLPTIPFSESFGPFASPFDIAFKSNQIKPTEKNADFFTIDSIFLKVIAKKAAGSRNYALDVVGYSDDKLLNVTSKVGAFLQNTDDFTLGYDENSPVVIDNNDYIGVAGQTGSMPQISGFKHIDDFGLSNLSISDKSQYFKQDKIIGKGGDHYKLSTLPIVDSTTFKEYIIPLSIYEDAVSIGKSKDYSMSSSFESLYLDLYPIPSGASICLAQLVVKYKPSNGLNLHTFARGSNELTRRTVKLLPSHRGISDSSCFNNGSGYAPISQINNIPQAFTSLNSIKTNYSKRWFGVEGTATNGPFNAAQFDYGYYNPTIDYPFTEGFYDFTLNSGNKIISINQTIGLGSLSGTFSGEYNSSIIKNVGLRFNDGNLFTNYLPGYSGSYTTTDWTSLSSGNKNFINDPFYGKIGDNFDTAIRLSGANGYINFGPIDVSQGFSYFIRFSPDLPISGVNYNLMNSGIIMSQFDNNAQHGLVLGYENGYLCAYAHIAGQTIKAKDTAHYSEYNFPLSAMITFKELNKGTSLTLYTDNESQDDWSIERSSVSSDDFENLLFFNPNNYDLLIGHCVSSGVGLNMFVSSIGISTNTKVIDAPESFQNITNFVHTLPDNVLYYDHNEFAITTNSNFRDSVYKLTDISRFFSSQRSYRASINSTYDKDRNDLHLFINKDIDQWHVGDFKVCQFSPDFDFFTKRFGKDYIQHKLKHSGSAYSITTNKNLPDNVNLSGISYHTQIENDFIRFYLSDVEDSFYSAHPRISKTLPAGYDFKTEAFVVDSIIEHDTKHNIAWNDEKVGPKLIVSLYSPQQDPAYLSDKQNWGLINRSIHYLKPSGCWQKLQSKFTYDNLIDTSEPWSNFDENRHITEFDTKYYSSDINDMYLQYDIVYPSGSSFESSIKIHSVNVRLADAIISKSDIDNNLNLFSFAEKKALSNINLYTYGRDFIIDSVNFYSSGQLPTIASSTINIFAASSYKTFDSIKLFTLNKNTIDSSTALLFGPNLFVSGRYEKFNEESLSIFTLNRLQDQTINTDLLLFTRTNDVVEIKNQYENINLLTVGSKVLESLVYRRVLSLFIAAPATPINYGEQINLWIDGQDYTKTLMDSSVNLFTINYPAINATLTQQYTITWDSDNPGSNIDVDDNSYASLAANDEIRGVELICYGNCNNEKL